ncbi:hypothetical protein D3C83_272730 [compost metagenome]
MARMPLASKTSASKPIWFTKLGFFAVMLLPSRLSVLLKTFDVGFAALPRLMPLTRS